MELFCLKGESRTVYLVPKINPMKDFLGKIWDRVLLAQCIVDHWQQGVLSRPLSVNVYFAHLKNCNILGRILYNLFHDPCINIETPLLLQK